MALIYWLLLLGLIVGPAEAQTVPGGGGGGTSVSTSSLAAAGTTQGTAAAIVASDTTITSCSSTAYAVALPAFNGVRYTLHNRCGLTVSVFPPGTTQIENGGAGAPAPLPSGQDATYIGYGSQWYS